MHATNAPVGLSLYAGYYYSSLISLLGWTFDRLEAYVVIFGTMKASTQGRGILVSFSLGGLWAMCLK